MVGGTIVIRVSALEPDINGVVYIQADGGTVVIRVFALDSVV